MSQARRPKLRAAWLACGFAFVGLVIYLSLTTSPIDAGRFEGVKVGHFIAYAWLTAWFAEIYKSARSRIAWGIGFILLGIALEYAQGMTSYRTFAYSDMRDNAYGVLAGLALAFTPFGELFEKLSRD
ncbi:MAG TPA: hypothetical protein VGI57_01545 [Usitatibacter sp.]|jgi:VanZ family protein